MPWLFLSFLLLLGGCASLPPQPATAGADQTLHPVPLAPGVWLVQGAPEAASAANRGFNSNAGIVATEQGTWLFDALGTPELGRALMQAAESLTGQPVVRVILSHYHADHFYGAQAMQEAGAAIWARDEGQAYLQSEGAQARLQQRRETLWPWVDEDTRLVAADRWLLIPFAEPLRVEWGGRRLQVISGGSAHAPDDTMLFVEDAGVLFAGDLYFTGRLPFVVGSNTRAWLAALDVIEALDPRVVVPGHGPASTDVSRDIGLTREYLLFLRSRMALAVEDLLTFEEAYAATDWSAFADRPTYAQAHRANAYSVYLEMQNEMLEGDGR